MVDQKKDDFEPQFRLTSSTHSVTFPFKMASLLVYLSTALLALFVYYGFKLYGSYKKRMALWKHYDQTPGFSPLAPLPHHWFFSQIASWIVSSLIVDIRVDSGHFLTS